MAVFLQSWSEHLQHLQTVFELLNQQVLLFYPRTPDRKWASEAPRSQDSNKSHPKMKQDIRASLGLTGYCRHFIDHYAARTLQLTDAVGRSQPDTVVWTNAMRKEFKNMKSAHTGDAVLYSPNFRLPFKLCTHCLYDLCVY